ncbi:MAG: phospholipase A [Pseudomonadota bacterium]
MSGRITRRVWPAALLLAASLTARGDGVIISTADNLILDGISLHKQNYILPLNYRSDRSQTEKMDFIYQFSAKIEAIVPELYLGYTQLSFWRYLDSQNSKPFRETNYNPEVFYHLTDEITPVSGWDGMYIGLEHESNGEPLPTSRSWNRFYLWPYWSSDHGEYSFKLWYRLPEDDKTAPDDPKGDDNPDIHRYFGYAEFYFYRAKSEGSAFSGMLRGNPSTGKGAIQMDYSWPLPNKNTYFFARIFSGYGESLIDYNQHVNRISIGLEFR